MLQKFRHILAINSTIVLRGGQANFELLQEVHASGRRIADLIIEYIIVMLMNCLLVSLTNSRALKDEPLSRGMFGM